mgnify:CR=1 FL=1
MKRAVRITSQGFDEVGNEPSWTGNQWMTAAPAAIISALLDCKPVEKSFGTQQSEEPQAELL